MINGKINIDNLNIFANRPICSNNCDCGLEEKIRPVVFDYFDEIFTQGSIELTAKVPTFTCKKNSIQWCNAKEYYLAQEEAKKGYLAMRDLKESRFIENVL